VGASVGDTVSSNTAVVTLADLEAPQILFWVEETDLVSVARGNAVNIVFEALPDDVFTGEILNVDPSLVRVDTTWAIQSWASVDLTAQPVALLSGMNAEVEIIAAEARNALLVPIQALREIAPDQYAVFVVQPNGELELRTVEVGLKDYVNAEIKSGLEVGESVSTGTVESSDTSSESSSGGEQPVPGMMRFFGGG
jgi:multidrug efflux pump subunit AcrA (membrane-fusion protein)